MIDPNILGAFIGIIFALLTMDVMMNLYKKTYHYGIKKSRSLLKLKSKNDKLRIIFDD